MSAGTITTRPGVRPLSRRELAMIRRQLTSLPAAKPAAGRCVS